MDNTIEQMRKDFAQFATKYEARGVRLSSVRIEREEDSDPKYYFSYSEV